VPDDVQVVTVEDVAMPKPDLPAWQLLASRPLLEHPFVRLVEDTVRLPSGRETRWWRFADGGRDTVCVIAVDTHGRVLVSYQYNHAPGRVVDQFPGGGVEPGEAYHDAARRELLEEAGLWAGQLTEVGAFLMYNRRSKLRCRVLVATEIEPREAAPDPEEITAAEWRSIAEINARIRSGELENGNLLAAWSLFRASRAVSPRPEAASSSDADGARERRGE
jgi:ADP-ribose pyrophosphatase